MISLNITCSVNSWLHSHWYDCLNIILLSFSVAPEISRHPKGLTTEEGKVVDFSCEVKGNPSPSVTWTKDGQRLNIKADSRLTASSANNSHNLTITGVHRSDAGQYRCVANNSVDSSTSSAAELEVNCKYKSYKAPLTSKTAAVSLLFEITWLFWFLA